MSHLPFTVLLAALVSTALAFAENRPNRESVYRAIYLFLYCLAITVAGGWTMRLIHG